MTKKELLEKAKRDYPIGTIFIGIGTPNKYELEKFQTANDHWETSNRIIVHCKENVNHGEYLYKDGVWAEIISKPELTYPTDVKYQKGDKVKVLREAKDHERGWETVWIDSMTSNIGKVLTVQEDNDLEGVLMKEGCRYPHFVLEKVEAVVASKTEVEKPSKEKPFYVVVTEENRDVLSKWRGGVALTAILNAGWITGLWENIGRAPSKEHNRIDSDNKNFGNEITFEQFLDLYPEYKEKVVEPVKTDVMKELTELPEKWCIYPTINSVDTLSRYFHSIGHKYVGYKESWKVVVHGGETNFYHVPQTRNGCWGEISIKPGYKEITFDQFKKWVLKESDTLKREDLVEGEIYWCNSKIYQKGFLLKFRGMNNTCILTSGILRDDLTEFDTDKLTESYQNNLRKATDEEKQWLQACIKAGKFVSLEDSKKVVNPLEGRYIKCLNDHSKTHYPCHKGDYLKFVTSDGIIEYWGAYNLDLSQDDTNNPRYFGGNVHKSTSFELMPVGFVPPVKVIVPEKGKWYEVTVNNTSQLSYIVKYDDNKYDDNKYGDCEYISKGSYCGVGMFINVNIVRELKANDPKITEPLLKYARMKYPIGCQIKSAMSGDKVEVSHRNTFMTSLGSIDNSSRGYLYYNGKWAEIVSLPEPKYVVGTDPIESNLNKTGWMTGTIEYNEPIIWQTQSRKENTSELIDINFDIPIVIGE